MTIGLDIGHSTVKVSATDTQGKAVRIIFPSVVCPTFAISDDAERRRAAEETVMIDGRLYFFGETALTQGGASATTGLSEDWIAQPEHAVLLLGALRKAVAAGVSIDRPMLALGLPTHLFARQRERLKDVVSRLVDTRELRILPQAMGPYQAVMLAANGMPAPDRNMADESWGVVEVGHFTTDFGLIQRGRWVEKASGACPGARVAAEHLIRLLGASGITVDLFEAEEAMRTRQIKHYGKRRDVSKEVDQAARMIVDQVVDTAVRLMEPYARQMDGVLVAGGGAHIVYQPLHSRWHHAQLVENPRFAVAEGLRRFASALTMARTRLQSVS